MHMVNALAITGDEGRGSLRNFSGSWQTSDEPEMPEWGNPASVNGGHRRKSGRTRGTETSKYP